jgi:hypothetical protein
LPNNADYYNVTATCSTKTFQAPPQIEICEPVVLTKKPAPIQTQSSTETDTSENDNSLSGRKPGLCLIIDKLKSIETKLDELKTLDGSSYDTYDSPLGLLLPEVGPTPTQEKCSIATDPDSPNKTPKLVRSSIGKTPEENNNEDDDTLKDDLEKSEINSQATDVSHTTELFVDDNDMKIFSSNHNDEKFLEIPNKTGLQTIPPFRNFSIPPVVTSPVATPTNLESLNLDQTDKALFKTSAGGSGSGLFNKSKVSTLKVDSAVDIMSIHTMSEIDDADDEVWQYWLWSFKLGVTKLDIGYKRLKMNRFK